MTFLKAHTPYSIPFNNSYARLSDTFYSRVSPTPVKHPKLEKVNEELAAELGIETSENVRGDLLKILAGNELPDRAEPIAMAYAGHQFGHFVPQLGDGRAILLGEIVTAQGKRLDLQLKGPGRTPFSRRGDGRAPLSAVIREYLISEALHALNIPTTRSLAIVSSGENVMRETPVPGGILTRVAASHIRIGTFEFFAARKDLDALRELADYTIERHYPELLRKEHRYLDLLDAVATSQAKLIAQWMSIGFIHGVMNTDNMSLSGETIDFGPCAFLDEYDPHAVFSSIDTHGRYAFSNQATIAKWNLARLAEAIAPLISTNPKLAVDRANDILHNFLPLFKKAYLDTMLRKIGITTARPGDRAMLGELLDLMLEHKADYTNTFRWISHQADTNDPSTTLQGFLTDSPALDAWLSQWRARLASEHSDLSKVGSILRAINPAYFPRNHLVEQALRAAVSLNDYTEFETLLAAVCSPFDEKEELLHLTKPPKLDERVHATFCGT